MRDRRRLDKAEREFAELAKRLAPKPGTYYAHLKAMSNEELKAERDKRQKECDEELKKLEGKIPPLDVARYDPGYAFDKAQLLCDILDRVWARRFTKEMKENRLIYEATLGEEERRRLDEEYKALVSMIGPFNKRMVERNKLFEARQKLTDSAMGGS